ncbi:MAG: hypothetical protein JST87_12585 [Bacteroidetes bacterium]|nr:hypothetical protein [Bacteroidota bacterium]MBS1935184.1 hypothetical protein [Bacteroidota bacterium]
MENKPVKNPVAAIIVIFVLVNILAFVSEKLFPSLDVSYTVVLIGNLILFIAAIFSFLIFRKGLKNTNPYAFVRTIYAGMLFRMAVCMIAVVIYIFAERSNVNKIGIFICCGLYLVYTFTEVRILLRLNKSQKNA